MKFFATLTIVGLAVSSPLRLLRPHKHSHAIPW